MLTTPSLLRYGEYFDRGMGNPAFKVALDEEAREKKGDATRKRAAGKNILARSDHCRKETSLARAEETET
jgi:hypothetical protein